MTAGSGCALARQRALQAQTYPNAAERRYLLVKVPREAHDRAITPPRCSGRHAQPVAHAGLCDDVMGARRIGLDFVAQFADVHPQQVRVLIVPRTPYLAQQVAVQQHFAGGQRQRLQERVLDGGERDLSSV